MAWKVVQEHMEKALRVWEVNTNAMGDQTILPQLLPWLDEAFESASFSRSDAEEGRILYFCLPATGIVSAAKLNFMYQLTTSFLSMFRINAVAVIILPNKAASESKKSHSPQRLHADILLGSVWRKICVE
jgi:hypothetical protein